ncbi:hypothetical protein [Bradyrhizobium sp. SZCCHNS2005]|uniref:hypothetical protein n=1 Tax=Bradyrhizobium sp. SZCCHNS2005 TaxID=3057303 RepID=UPI0028EB5E04|nr:hypothetical protein [Bradyrhizobium sp. SZCCHNS2005]
MRETILSAAKDLKSYRRPEGKKWSSFYLKKSKFVASEVYNEDEGDIRAKVKKVIENIEADANEIFATIAKALSPAQ